MLMQKPPAQDDIVSIKLTNGDEIVAKLVAHETHACVVSRPALVSLQSTAGTPGAATHSFVPFMISAPDNAVVSVPHTAILGKAVATRADIATSYQTATKTMGVAPPTKICDHQRQS